jgi:type IV pilus assembly protein PilB
MTTPEPAWLPLGALLHGAGLISEQQLAQALARQTERACRLGQAIVDLGFLTDRQIAAALAEQYDLEFVSFAATPPEPNAVQRLPEELARRYAALPARVLDDGRLLLAVADPTNVSTADELRLALGQNFTLAVAELRELELAISRAYRPKIELVPVADDVEEGAAEVHDIRDLSSSKPTIAAVNTLLATALEDGASDLHFEPQRNGAVVRARIDGVMREVSVVPRHMQSAVASRLKVMGRLDLAERRAPQDGRVTVTFGGEPLDLRIAVLPSRHGEQIVLRILNRQERRPSFADLGMDAENQIPFLHALAQPYGAIVVCGPTGSGKTTTLYAGLELLNQPQRAIMTIEDPIEQELPGVNQIEVDPKSGLTVARGLRTLLRSDPDVLMVGEIRDEETAAIAFQAAMTGHLVLASLHAHSAPAAIVRLRDMGVPAPLIASSLNCLVAQRLVRRLCNECREPYEARPGDIGLADADGALTIYKPVGCPTCANTGYTGRVALYEVLAIHGEVRALIEESTEMIFHAAVRNGMRTLREAGVRLVVDGVTSVEEVRRVTGDRLT